MTASHSELVRQGFFRALKNPYSDYEIGAEISPSHESIVDGTKTVTLPDGYFLSVSRTEVKDGGGTHAARLLNNPMSPIVVEAALKLILQNHGVADPQVHRTKSGVWVSAASLDQMLGSVFSYNNAMVDEKSFITFPRDLAGSEVDMSVMLDKVRHVLETQGIKPEAAFIAERPDVKGQQCIMFENYDVLRTAGKRLHVQSLLKDFDTQLETMTQLSAGKITLN